MPKYNKLIRDRIPEIFLENGKKSTTSILSKMDYIIELRAKLQEEVPEYFETPNAGKLAVNHYDDFIEMIQLHKEAQK